AKLYNVPFSFNSDSLATQLQLQTVAEENVSKLSHGWRKRLALALSLIHQPELWLMDEPFSGLDDGGIECIRRAIVGAAQAGKTIILSTPLGAQSIQAPHLRWRLDQGQLVAS